jgi:hypothetical protein
MSIRVLNYWISSLRAQLYRAGVLCPSRVRQRTNRLVPAGLAHLLSRMIDVISPGPANRGMSWGKIATSVLSSAASVSASVVGLCRCGGRRPRRSKAGATRRRNTESRKSNDESARAIRSTRAIPTSVIATIAIDLVTMRRRVGFDWRQVPIPRTRISSSGYHDGPFRLFFPRPVRPRFVGPRSAVPTRHTPSADQPVGSLR